MRTRAMLAAAMAAGALVSACSMTPAVTKQTTTMTPKQIADAGLECRRETPMGTNMPRTVCAAPEAWAKVDAEAKYESELAFDKARSGANAGAFNRP